MKVTYKPIIFDIIVFETEDVINDSVGDNGEYDI